jgi:glutamate-1-semialdehyde 2,1-aminomutase
MAKTQSSKPLLQRARAVIPGAVNSPVRAWNAVGGSPLFIDRAAGAHLFDSDGNRYVDFVGAFGPAILGHAHPRVVDAIREQVGKGLSYGASCELEVQIAETISNAIPIAEKVRLLSSGTEAGMTAVRLARAATGRPGIIKFAGCYHGHSDSLLVRAGSGAMTLGIPDSAGVPESLASLTRVASYNSTAEVERYFESQPRDIAAIIVEPIAANMGVVKPDQDFLPNICDTAHKFGALVIFDEVITGFRLRYGAAYEMLGAQPDLIMLGKVIGGGMPIAAVAGRSDLMDILAPEGPVYQAGTLSGNPIAVRAGLETLAILKEPGTYERLERSGARLEAGFNEALGGLGHRGCVNRVGSLLTLFLGVAKVTNSAEAGKADTKQFARVFHSMLKRGFYLPPSQFEAMFLSLEHSDDILDAAIEAAKESLAETERQG